MSRENDILYAELAAHLDRLPGGFPPSPNGAHLRLLQYLFTPEEAALAVHLTMELEPSAAIAGRAGLPTEQIAATLESMADKGLCITEERPEGRLYRALPWVVGIYEMQINRLDTGFRRRVLAYWGTAQAPERTDTLRQMRTIPVGEAIANTPGTLPYQRVTDLVAAQTTYAVLPCICRSMAHLHGQGCDAPLESCLAFGEWAEYIVRTGRGRQIEREEVLAIIERAQEANLVLQPSNSQQAAFLCCCCSCCCGVLGELKRAEAPAEVVDSDYITRFDPGLCVQCGACLACCPMGAFSEGEAHPEYDPRRCIGCGLCVASCPSGALTLVQKPEEERHPVPQTLPEAWRIIMHDQDAQRAERQG